VICRKALKRVLRQPTSFYCIYRSPPPTTVWMLRTLHKAIQTVPNKMVSDSFRYLWILRSRHSSVGTATDCWAGRPGFDFRQEHGTVLHSVHTGSRTHPDSYPKVTDGVKRPGRKSDHSPPSIAEDKNCGAVLPLPHTTSCRDASVV
jgi:hypothetical protein